MKRILAFVLTMSMLFLLAAAGGCAAFAEGTAANGAEKAYLTGHWDETVWIRNGLNTPFYLDNIVTDADWVEFTMTVPNDPRGYPYGDWYLYALDKDGKYWEHVGKFTLGKDMTQGAAVTVFVALDTPSTFKALTISPVEGGMDFTLSRLIDFYTDPACIPESARGAEPDDFDAQLTAYTGRTLPYTEQTVNYEAYSAPGSKSDDGWRWFGWFFLRPPAPPPGGPGGPGPGPGGPGGPGPGPRFP